MNSSGYWLCTPNKNVIPECINRESMDPRLKLAGMTKALLAAL
jgi:hypothetical protein